MTSHMKLVKIYWLLLMISSAWIGRMTKSPENAEAKWVKQIKAFLWQGRKRSKPIYCAEMNNAYVFAKCTEHLSVNTFPKGKICYRQRGEFRSAYAKQRWRRRRRVMTNVLVKLAVRPCKSWAKAHVRMEHFINLCNKFYFRSLNLSPGLIFILEP